MKIAARTDIGCQRSENQDNYRAGRQPDDTAWALVCDGMGGANGGKVASGIAARYMEQAFSAQIDALRAPDAVRRFLFDTVDETNQLIYEQAEKDMALRGMGTTLVCALLREDLLQYAHVGDSRAYLYRDAVLTQLTKDHSMVQELLEQGSITEQEATNHPQKNLITRALGVGPNVDVDYDEQPLHSGDLVLLCTDGLTNLVADGEIAHTLESTPFYDAADALVQKALDAGGYDNVTVLLVKAEPAEDDEYDG